MIFLHSLLILVVQIFSSIIICNYRTLYLYLHFTKINDNWWLLCCSFWGGDSYNFKPAQAASPINISNPPNCQPDWPSSSCLPRLPVGSLSFLVMLQGPGRTQPPAYIHRRSSLYHPWGERSRLLISTGAPQCSIPGENTATWCLHLVLMFLVAAASQDGDIYIKILLLAIHTHQRQQGGARRCGLVLHIYTILSTYLRSCTLHQLGGAFFLRW